MTKTDLYTAILKKLSSHKEQNIISLSFLNEIMYYTIRISNTTSFINKVVDVIAKYLSPSAVYLLDEQSKTINLQYSTIKDDMPSNIKLQNYTKFIKTLTRKGSPDLNIKEMESSKDIAECVSFHKQFSIIPLSVRNVRLPLGIIVIDIDLNTVELPKLQALNIAIVLISNTINQINLIDNKRYMERKVVKLILKTMYLVDLPTYKHSLRVKRYSLELAKMLSLPDNHTKRLHLSSLVHDFGKITMPYNILHKEEKLSEKEFEMMKQHTIIGYRLLKELPFFKESLPDILNHHEKIDGSGYPNGITNISITTQILAISDIIDAISSTRAYKEEKGATYLINELGKLKGKLDDTIVETAIKFVNSNRFLAIKKKIKNLETHREDIISTSIGHFQEKLHQLKTENKNLSKEVELYKKLLSKAQKTIEDIAQKSHSENKNYEKYKGIIKAILDTVNPLSIVFVTMQNDCLSIARVKGKPINFENSVQILSNKKLFSSISSGNTYISRKLAAFPLFENEAVCVFLSKDSNVNENTLNKLGQSIEKIIKSESNQQT